MNRRIFLCLALALLCAVILAGGVLALSSGQYRLDWFTPLTTGGGGQASSDHYALHLSVGQVARGAPSSPHYQLCLGYWCGAGFRDWVYLPLVTRDHGP
jgi:hypothetical protein